MKKWMLGFVAGIALTIGAQVHAEIGSVLGKTVEGMLPLLIDGKRASSDVVVIEGISYLPVRAASELFGYEAGFADGQVLLYKSATNSGRNGQPNVANEADEDSAQSASDDSDGRSGRGKVTVIRDEPDPDTPYTFKSTFMVLGTDKVRLVVRDGEQYVPISVFDRYVGNDGKTVMIAVTRKQIVRFPADQPYSAGVDGYAEEGVIYIKLSALGLKADFKSNAYYVEKL